MPRISANLGFLWADRPIAARIEAAAAAGFAAIELHYPYDTEPQRVRRLCDRLGLTLLSLNTDIDPDRGEFGLAAVPGRGADAAALIDKAFDWAAEAGARAVHVMAGSVAGADRASARAAFEAALDHAAARASASGIGVLIEPLNRFDAPGYFLATTDDALTVIEERADPALRLMFDAYHVLRQGEDVLDRLAACWPVIGHVQIAGVPDRHEPDSSAVDLAPFLRDLDRRGWGGWVGAEYRPRDGVEEGLGWIDKLDCRLG